MSGLAQVPKGKRVQGGSSISPKEFMEIYLGKPVVSDEGVQLGTVVGVVTSGHGDAYIDGVRTDGGTVYGTHMRGYRGMQFEDGRIVIMLSCD